MSDTVLQYVRRRPGLSWHVVRTHTRMFDGWRTLCGRSIIAGIDAAPALDTLPGAKSCESCLRIFVKGIDPISNDSSVSLDSGSDNESGLEDDASTQPETVP